MNVETLQKKLIREKICYVDLKYASLTGTLHHITIPIERLCDVTRNGVGADGSSLPGYKAVEKGDMLLLPDLSTLSIDPFFEQKTASFLCSIYVPDTLKPFQRDTRHVAHMAVDYCRRELKTSAFFQPELEFYIFEHASFGEGPGSSYYHLDTTDRDPNAVIFPIRYRGGYHIGPPEDRYYNFRNDVLTTLKSCNIPCKYHHHEVGARGQMEVELLFRPLVTSADDIFLAKYIIKCLGRSHGLYATFMPKPLLDEPGSGLHLHQYLGTDKRSLFYGHAHANKLSQMCLHYIAGILHHSRALCAFVNPSTNSYKRLIPGFEAPTYADFGVGSRKTAIRLPKYLKNKKMMNIEYRIPDATANPYLALAAVLLAGIDGIKNRYKVDKREKLPHNVYEATNALKQDYTFLLNGNVFSMDLIESWIEVKTKQFEDIHNRPHPYEFTLYFGV
ncbi:type I glutamate--ammonia ligase [candidate division WOR-3 bacterium]|nr:type I glutamate--ammonia ligase [candidate division WOR-3 bacterium]